MDTIRNLDEQEITTISANTFTDNKQAMFNHYPTFNPPDKLMESIEEVKRPNAEQLQLKQPCIRHLEKVLNVH